MAGLEGIIQQLTDQRDAKRAEAEALGVEVEALNQAIAAIRARMNGQVTTHEASEGPSNPFQEGTLPHDVWNVLGTEEMHSREIFTRIAMERSCTRSGVENAIYKHPEAFGKVREGVFRRIGL
jgi:hypothetical protein